MSREFVKLFREIRDLDGVAEVDGLFAEILLSQDDIEFLRILPTQVDWPEQGFCHDGEEALFVVSGIADYYLGQEVISLAPGDWLWHPSNIPHHLERRGRECVTVLAAVCHVPWWSEGKQAPPGSKYQVMANGEKAYLYVPAKTWLDKREIGDVELRTQLIGTKITSSEVVFPRQGTTFEFPKTRGEGINLVNVLSGGVRSLEKNLIDEIGPDQAAIFTNGLDCSLVADGPTRLLWFCIEGSSRDSLGFRFRADVTQVRRKRNDHGN